MRRQLLVAPAADEVNGLSTARLQATRDGALQAAGPFVLACGRALFPCCTSARCSVLARTNDRRLCATRAAVQLWLVQSPSW